ncbi:MAG TPA: glutamine-hydrolyzing carbamoyl-phosphate synthase small subunit [Bdellovibrionota bacterium]|jgi:carbamoyl-phosphate synthase small subunit|nr:glutamine-hydrolyzing carbamoyl-phosphate synthase small subunit [Bdellovibrionota bacterium]
MFAPTQNPKGLLVLEGFSGQKPLVFPGFLFGAIPTAQSLEEAMRGRNPAGRDKGYGEVVFNTCMTGYQEVLTDPSYYGQMVVMTVPHIGNTGVNKEDVESGRPWASGFVVHANCFHASNWRSQSELHSYLLQAGIPGIQGVDTRALTVALRSQGVVRGLILPASEASRADGLLALLPSFEGRDLLKEVTTPEAYPWRGDGDTYKAPKRPAGVRRYRVVAVDYGVKWNLLRSLAARGCDLEVVPAQTTADEILKRKPDGVFLSNGPGDPAAATYAVEAVRGVLGKVPVFGVCMGHQILSLALGGKTYKLKFGHHGGNQPVLDKRTGKVEISSQNHGYAVDPRSLPQDVEVTHVNLNDRTVEGLAAPHKRAFSVQYHPEASPGPQDSDYLFDEFITQMSGTKK